MTSEIMLKIIFIFTELKKVPKSKISHKIKGKMKETKKLKKSCFVNI